MSRTVYENTIYNAINHINELEMKQFKNIISLYEDNRIVEIHYTSFIDNKYYDLIFAIQEISNSYKYYVTSARHGILTNMYTIDKDNMDNMNYNVFHIMISKLISIADIEIEKLIYSGDI